MQSLFQDQKLRRTHDLCSNYQNGVSYSYAGSDYSSLDERLGTLILSFKGENANSAFRSFSFKQDSEPLVLKDFGSGKMIIEGSLGFKGREKDLSASSESPRAESDDSIRTTSFKASRTDNSNRSAQEHLDSKPSNAKNEAALKLQKVYKSFRTRRKLADCAVLVEQHWWKLLDFALLKRSSVSFFDVEGPESVISRWSRARTRAAMVGKGLSKNEKARKLALQHWLQAIDPRHRYGHNLHFYYVSWLQCDSRQPFFYWLDVGEGKEVNLERCPRPKLQQQCIKYLGPKERETCEIIVQDGKFVYKKTREMLDTSEGPKDSKWIFVLSTSKKLYVGQKKRGTFQHSSFLAGGATSAAGRLVVEKGFLKAVWPHSGHYRPTEENFQELVSFLEENNVDLTDVKKIPTEEDEESFNTKIKNHAKNASELSSLATGIGKPKLEQEDEGQRLQFSNEKKHHTTLVDSRVLNCDSGGKDTSAFDRLYTLCVQNLFREFEGDSDEDADEKTCYDEESKRNNSSKMATNETQDDEPSTCERQHYTLHKWNLFEDEQNGSSREVVPQELILRRINSKKEMKSLQLGKQLCCRWTTGAGPRIGIVRDYPSELQFQALEQVNLSPRSAARIYASSCSPRDLVNSTHKAARSFIAERN